MLNCSRNDIVPLGHVIETTRLNVVSVRSLTIGSSPLAEK